MIESQHLRAEKSCKENEDWREEEPSEKKRRRDPLSFGSGRNLQSPEDPTSGEAGWGGHLTKGLFGGEDNSNPSPGFPKTPLLSGMHAGLRLDQMFLH